MRAHSDGENMILMQTSRNLSTPDGSAAELVEVAALCKQHISGLQRISRCVTPLDLNFVDLIKLQVAILNVRNTQVG